MLTPSPCFVQSGIFGTHVWLLFLLLMRMLRYFCKA